MKRNRVFIMACNAIAAVCFELAGYGYFSRGNKSLGIVFFVLCAAQLVLALTQYYFLQKEEKNDNEEE